MTSVKKIELSNSHSWFKENPVVLSLELENNKIKNWVWKQRNGKEVEDLLSVLGIESKIGSIAEKDQTARIIENITMLFAFTGSAFYSEFCKEKITPFEFIYNLYVVGKDYEKEKDKDKIYKMKTEMLEILSLLYKEKLDEPIVLVKVALCGCNMGHCTAPVGIKKGKKCYTYGDVLEKIGNRADFLVNGKTQTYYEYPDSVGVYIKEFNSQMEIYDGTCYGKKSKLDFKKEDAGIYLEVSYSR